MEVMPGYKMTEVGVIPEDWEIHTIGNSMRLINGRAFKPEDWKDRGIPIIRIQNLNDTESAFNYYSGHVEDKHRIEAGDILFAWSGTTGTSFGARIWGGPTGVLNQHIFKVLPDQEKLTPRFAFLVLLNVQEHIEKQAHGFKASFVHVKKSDLVSIQLPVPPTKAEQEAITEVLSNADALIESYERLIAKKRLLKKGVMQKLLTGKRRLRGFANATTGYKQTEVGVIPEDWAVKTLGEIGESLIGLTYKPSDVRSDGLLVLRSSNVFEGALRFEDNVFVGLDVPEKIIVRNGDILICVRNGSRDLIGKCARIDERAQGMTFGAFMAVFRTPFHNFVYHQFQSDVIKRQIHECLGATINQITNKSLNSFRISFPKDEEEQTAIATILSDMDAEIALLKAQLAKYRQLKQGLMQKLLTGRIRLV